MAGELNIVETFDNGQFINALNQSNQKLSEHRSIAVKEADSINEALMNIGKIAAGYFGIQALESFIKELVTIRGEFQQFDVAFTTMLNSQERSTKLMSQLTETAAHAPFTLTEIAGAAKELIAFQIPAEKVNDTISTLG